MNFYEQLEKGRYGSFELKKQVGPNLLKGFVFSLLLLSAVTASPFVLNLIRGEQPVPIPDTVVKTGTILVPWDRPHPPGGAGRIPLPKRPVSKNPLPIAVDVSDSDTLIMEVSTPGTGSGKEVNDSGSGGYGSGFDTSLFTGLVPPDDFIPPDTEYISREIEPVPLDINPQPVYPSLALTTGMAGKVTVNVYVDKNGNVKKWKLMKATPSDLGFDDEVLKVVPRWKFTPAVQSGKPVGVWVAIPFKFTLKR